MTMRKTSLISQGLASESLVNYNTLRAFRKRHAREPVLYVPLQRAGLVTVSFTTPII